MKNNVKVLILINWDILHKNVAYTCIAFIMIKGNIHKEYMTKMTVCVHNRIPNSKKREIL